MEKNIQGVWQRNGKISSTSENNKKSSYKHGFENSFFFSLSIFTSF